jgi:Tfp pilus assembly protein PilX
MNRRRIHPTATVRTGYSLTEILFVLGLLTIFAVVATRLFGSTVRIMYASADEQNTTSALDSAMRALRGDAWNASTLATPDPHSLRIAQAEQSVEWSIDQEGNLIRSTHPAKASATAQRWPGLGRHLAFESAGAAVNVRVLDQRQKPSAQVSLVSQVMLAREEKP